MSENPLKAFERLDPKLMQLVEDTRNLAFSEGVLPRKVKLLIAMALDASQGAAGGVKSLAQAAMQAGASKEEIAEALRVTHYITGAGSIYTAAQGLKELF
jgi:alkylhydroperoxidase/carboxymuconolactone decarboxylase family protein YurZ